jgi:hypothetical protein
MRTKQLLNRSSWSCYLSLSDRAKGRTGSRYRQRQESCNTVLYSLAYGCRLHTEYLVEHTGLAVALGGLVFSVLATGPKVREFDPDRSTTSFGGKVKPSVPCRRFTGMKEISAATSHPSLLTACQMAESNLCGQWAGHSLHQRT